MCASMVRKTHPTKVNGDLFGYRWIVDNSFYSLYIVKIRINNCYFRKANGIELENVAEDWTIIEIIDAIHHKSVERIPGRTHAYYLNNVEYYVGNHVTNEEVYFCLSVDDLIKNQYSAMKANEKICLMDDDKKKCYIKIAKEAVPEWFEK